MSSVCRFGVYKRGQYRYIDKVSGFHLQRHADDYTTFQDREPEYPTLSRQHGSIIPMMSGVEARILSIQITDRLR